LKIERVDIHTLEAELDRPFGWSHRWIGRRGTTVVRVATEDGLVGWGESSLAPDIRTAAESLAPLLIGEDPAGTGAIWQKLFESVSQAHGFTGAAMCAVSAFDTALWDIAGKAVGQPVHRLLGGAVRDSVAVYATGLYYTEDDYPDAIVREATGYADQGFTGMKMKIGGVPISEDVRRVYAIRDAIGPDVHLMVDANEAYNAPTAIQVARRIADAGITWFEEPCPSYDDEANLRVKAAAPMPISGGESLKTRYEFGERLARRVFDIVQPDVVNVGGVSELAFVGGVANSFGVQFNPHFWGTGISFAASLHVCATLPLTPPAIRPEPYAHETVLEFDQTPHPVRANLTAPGFEVVGSRVRVPDGPGLGIEVDEKALERFAAAPSLRIATR